MSARAAAPTSWPTPCTYDSGSVSGCRPLCDAPAAVIIYYRNGSGPEIVAPVCAAHRRPMESRAWPSAVTVDTVPRYVCKACGGESPTGVGYAATTAGPLPAPADGCGNPHAVTA